MYNYKFQAILIQIIVAEIINDHITVQPLEKVRANHMICGIIKYLKLWVFVLRQST